MKKTSVLLYNRKTYFKFRIVRQLKELVFFIENCGENFRFANKNRKTYFKFRNVWHNKFSIRNVWHSPFRPFLAKNPNWDILVHFGRGGSIWPEVVHKKNTTDVS